MHNAVFNTIGRPCCLLDDTEEEDDDEEKCNRNEKASRVGRRRRRIQMRKGRGVGGACWCRNVKSSPLEVDGPRSMQQVPRMMRWCKVNGLYGPKSPPRSENMGHRLRRRGDKEEEEEEDAL